MLLRSKVPLNQPARPDEADIDTAFVVYDETFQFKRRPAAIRMVLHSARIPSRGSALEGLGWTVMLPIWRDGEVSVAKRLELQVHGVTRDDAWITHEFHQVVSPSTFWGTWEWHDA